MIITIYYAVIIVLYNNCICFDAFDEKFYHYFFSNVLQQNYFSFNFYLISFNNNSDFYRIELGSGQ